MKWAVVLLPLAYLWFRLINNLRLEWATNPQYSYGWVVPFLCIGLLLRRWQAGAEEGRGQGSEISGKKAEVRPLTSDLRLLTSILVFLAFLYLPTRLVEEATPEWRPIQWALGIEAIGLTLCAISLLKGRGWLRQVAFPLCFFFVAIPWPTLIEQPVIQSLTRINSAITVEVLGWTGIPAIQHGNLIEVGTGTVGVDEACSGIRSFQTSLMISLFFGEFYRMSLARRLLLVPAGFILAMAFNVCRMTFLTTVAAKKGVAAIAQYHDPAGIMITLVCTAGLWGLAVIFCKRQKSEIRSQRSEVSNQRSAVSDQKSEVSGPRSVVRNQKAEGRSQTSDLRPLISGVFRLAIALLVWLVAVEAGAELWYRSVESHLAPSPKWTAMFPTNNPTFQTLPIDAKTKYLLRFDEGKQAAWTESDGSRWNASYFSWSPGRVAGYLAKRHTPEICLPATGRKMVSGPELTMMNINGVALPMRSYVFETEGGAMYVFHCRWEAGVDEDTYVTHESARFNLIRGIWAGRGKYGQKVLEVIVSGYADSAQAKSALARQLQPLIKVERPAEVEKRK
jgi:exosortase